jgi:glucose/arabinose dehydrogenase/plastocyanin
LRRGIAVLVALLVLPASAHADSVVHSSAFQFVPPVVPLDRGGDLTYTNADVAPHNVVALDKGADGRPLFSSGQPVGNGVDTVEGVADLAAGSYGFFCELHPNMRGELRVEDVDLPDLPDLRSVTLPTGVVPTPTSLTAHDGALYVTSWQQGTVQRLEILEGGLLGQPTTYAEGFGSPLGVAFAPDGTMFVADSHPSTRAGRTTDGRVWAVSPGGGAKEVVVDELPNGRHNTNGMAVRDGRVYVTNGNSTDDGVAGGDPEEPLSGTLISVPVAARGLTPASPELIVEARGMRNLYDVAFRPGTSEAWIPTNGPDALDPYGEDTLLKADVAGEAPDFGFPGCVYAAPPTEPPFAQNPAVADTNPCDPLHAPPEQLLGLHASADGLAFGPEGGIWDGDLFIAEFGSFQPDTPTGHKVVRVPIDEAGRSGAPQTFFVGAAPLDLTFGPPGTGLYVADFATGQITLIRG